MSSRKFEYYGDLASTPLPEILATIHRYRVPGIVSLTREGRVRRLFLDDGAVLFAASNEKETGLAAYLLERGILDAETARLAEERQAHNGLRIGQVLLQMGVLTPESLNEAVTGRVREILLTAFDWDAGEVLFQIGARRPADFARLDLPIPEVILGGIRRAANVRRMVARLGSAQTLLEKSRGPEISLFSPVERKFHESVDGRTPLQQLCARGPGGEADNARLLYAFFCLGLVRKARPTSPGARKIQYKTGGGTLGN